MKKLLILVLALVMVLSLAACGGGAEPAPSGGSTDPGASQQEPSSSEQPSNSTSPGTSKKVDGGEMGPAPEKFTNNPKVLDGTGLENTLIGTPIGYTYQSYEYMKQPLSAKPYFTSDDGELHDEDVTLYAKALWNMLIDVADDGKLLKKDRSSEEGYALVENFEDTILSANEHISHIRYIWYYRIDGAAYKIEIGIDEKDANLYAQFVLQN